MKTKDPKSTNHTDHNDHTDSDDHDTRRRDQIVVIGFGNPMRGDDGFGWEVAERLADVFAMERDISVVSSFQALPEFAEMISTAQFALFIDAQVGIEPGCIRCRSIQNEALSANIKVAPPGRGPAIGSHHTTPQEIVLGARILYGYAPPAALLTVGAASLDYGTPLSPKVVRLVNPAIRIAQLVIKQFQDAPGRAAIMHEFAVVEGVVNQALAALDELLLDNQGGANQNAGSSDALGESLSPGPLVEVTVQRSSDFSEAALFTAFEALTQGTSLEGAVLKIETLDHAFTCGCGYQQVLQPDDLIGHMYVCPACGAIHEIAEAHGITLLGVRLLEPSYRAGER